MGCFARSEVFTSRNLGSFLPRSFLLGMIGFLTDVWVSLEQTEREHASVAAIVRQIQFPQSRYFPIGVHISEVYSIHPHTNIAIIEEDVAVW